MKITTGHGEVSTFAPIPFTQILPPHEPAYDADKLAAMAAAMGMDPDSVSDGGDPEENLFMPAGYTYLGQFIDHDLTLDTTSTLNPDDVRDPTKRPTDQRSPRFDLDCVYGNGPSDQPYMYDTVTDAAKGTIAGVTLIVGDHDLARAANQRAIIGDKRNDENSIVNQIQQAFIRFHNRLAAMLAKDDPSLMDGPQGSPALFAKTRDFVRWSYQSILVNDFLPRLVSPIVLDDFLPARRYQLYKDGPLRAGIPREFAGAAYRFGHSQVRKGYRLNRDTILPIFRNPELGPDKSLVGFQPLPADGSHVIDDWGRFFPADTPRPGERRLSDSDPSADVGDDGQGGLPAVRLQYAYKQDPSITDPLANLPSPIATKDELPPALRNFPATLPKTTPPLGPSLALINLLRGNIYAVASGQSVAKALGVLPLDKTYLRVRRVANPDAPDGTPNLYRLAPIGEFTGATGTAIGSYFDNDTPLWFYILAEAQKPIVDFWLALGGDKDPSITLTENQLKGLDPEGNPIAGTGSPAQAAAQELAQTACAGTQLGPVGGRIVVEVFYGLLDSDVDSLFNRGKDAQLPAGWAWPKTMAQLLAIADPDRAPSSPQR